MYDVVVVINDIETEDGVSYATSKVYRCDVEKLMPFLKAMEKESVHMEKLKA